MNLSPAQITALLLAQPVADGRYHLTHESGVTYPTVRVLVREELVQVIRFEDHREERKNLVVPQYDWEVTLTKLGLQQRDVWRRFMWQAADDVEAYKDPHVERLLQVVGL